MDEFDILQIVGEGWFGKILLVEHKATDTEMVLKGTEHLTFFFIATISIALNNECFSNVENVFSPAKALRVHSGLLSRISSGVMLERP